MGVGVVRLERDGALVALQRFLVLLEFLECVAQVAMDARHGRVLRQRRTQEAGGQFVIPLLESDDTDMVQGLDVLRDQAQYLFIGGRGLFQFALVMELQAFYIEAICTGFGGAGLAVLGNRIGAVFSHDGE